MKELYERGNIKMNFLEAIEEIKKGNKVRRKGWVENVYMYAMNGIFQTCELIDGQKIRKSLKIDDLQTVLADDWEIYKSEEEILIKKGKLFDIAKYCENHSCNNCIIRDELSCDKYSLSPCRCLLNKIFLIDDWSDEKVDKLYKLIKEEV